MAEYRKLDKSKLANRKRRTLSTEEALKDISPIQWSESVLNGSKKVLIQIK